MTSRHTHKLKRHVYKTGAKTYFCVGDCSFRVACELALGKTAVCWRCGRDFQMNVYSITLAKPHCEDCHIHKGSENRKKLRRKDDPVVENVTQSVGSAVIGSLSERLAAISAGAKSIANEIKKSDDGIEYKPFTEDDEDIL